MPEQKGRKRKPSRARRDRTRDPERDAPPAGDQGNEPQPARSMQAANRRPAEAGSSAEPPLPGRGVRLAAVILALVTAAFAVGLFYSAVVQGSGIDLVVRLAGSVILFALAAAIAVLALAPGAVRARVRR